MWYCLPDSSLLLSYNPETASRVTLATLGIVFQTILFTTDTHLCFSHFYRLLIHIIYTDAHLLLLVITMKRCNKIWLEANTERSESNPGRSLGIYRAYSDCCLEDSTAQRTKHPRQSDKSVLKKTQWRNEHGLHLRLYGAGLPPARDNP